MTGNAGGGKEYRIVIDGELHERFGRVLEGMRIQPEHGTTVMTGTVRDQAHLMGVIEQIHEFGLELLSVKRLSRRGGGGDRDVGPEA